MSLSEGKDTGYINQEACSGRQRFLWIVGVAHPGGEAWAWAPLGAKAWA